MITLNRAIHTITFEFFRPSAQTVHLAGTFNDWSCNSIRLNRQNDGWWRITIEDFEPGDYAFQYVVDGNQWFPDFAAHGNEMNAYGGWQSLLSIPEWNVASESLEAAQRPEILRVVTQSDDQLAPIPFQKSPAQDQDTARKVPNRAA